MMDGEIFTQNNLWSEINLVIFQQRGVIVDVRYFPKGFFLKWQLPKGIFPSGNFPNVQFPKFVLAAALGLF